MLDEERPACHVFRKTSLAFTVPPGHYRRLPRRAWNIDFPPAQGSARDPAQGFQSFAACRSIFTVDVYKGLLFQWRDLTGPVALSPADPPVLGQSDADDESCTSVHNWDYDRIRQRDTP